MSCRGTAARRISAVTAAILVVTSCSAQSPRYTIRAGSARLSVEVARTEGQRALGLMYRDALPDNHGMLFIFDEIAPRSFWMKDTRIPLSIAYMASDGTVLEIHHMEPFSLEPVRSRAAVPLALEVNQGWFERNGVRIGDQFDLSRIPDLPSR